MFFLLTSAGHFSTKPLRTHCSYWMNECAFREKHWYKGKQNTGIKKKYGIKKKKHLDKDEGKRKNWDKGKRNIQIKEKETLG